MDGMTAASSTFFFSLYYTYAAFHTDENETAEAAKQIKVECREKFSHRKKQAKKQQRKKEKKNSAEKETSGAGHLPVQKDDGGARWSNHHK
jgi:hypothetical protein